MWPCTRYNDHIEVFAIILVGNSAQLSLFTSFLDPHCVQSMSYQLELKALGKTKAVESDPNPASVLKTCIPGQVMPLAELCHWSTCTLCNMEHCSAMSCPQIPLVHDHPTCLLSITSTIIKGVVGRGTQWQPAFWCSAYLWPQSSHHPSPKQTPKR